MPINYKKLLNSKWTAVTPIGKAKHFEVVKVEYDEQNQDRILQICLEAIVTKNMIILGNERLKELSDDKLWKKGWK